MPFQKGHKIRLGIKHSLQTKKKISEHFKGLFVGEKNPFFGRKHSDETKKHWSEIRKGRKESEETKLKKSTALKGRLPWNTGLHLSDEHKKKVSIALKGRRGWTSGIKLSLQHKYRIGLGVSEEKNPAWKGDHVGYRALHGWVRKHLGAPSKCEACGIDGLSGRRIQWANKSREYKRDRHDWIRLCVKCHFKHDGLADPIKGHKNLYSKKKIALSTQLST